MALALRCFRLGAQSLWIDEALTWVSSGIGHPLAVADLLDNVHGPLYSVVLHLWTGVAGDSEWALRLPSAVCGAALVPAIAVLALRWLGREHALAAAWLAAGSPFAVWFGREARNYALLMLCVAAAGAAVLGWRARPTTRGATAYLAAAAGGLLTNLSFVFLAPLHARWGLGNLRSGRRLLAGLAVIAALALILSPWVPEIAHIWDWRRLQPARGAVQDEVPLRGATTFHAAALPWAADVFAVGFTLGPPVRALRRDPGRAVREHVPEVLASALVFAPLLVLGVRGLARRGRVLDALLWFGVPAVAVSYAAIQNFKVFHPRYLTVSFPAFLLVVALGFAELGPRVRTLFALAVAGLWAWSLFHLYFDPRYGKEDYRSAFAVIRERARPGEELIAVGADHPVVYYNRGRMPVKTLWLGFVQWPDRLDRELDATLAGSSGAWIVLSRDEDLDPTGVFERRLGQRRPDAGSYAFEGVKLWHLAGASAAPAAPH